MSFCVDRAAEDEAEPVGWRSPVVGPDEQAPFRVAKLGIDRGSPSAEIALGNVGSHQLPTQRGELERGRKKVANHRFALFEREAQLSFAGVGHRPGEGGLEREAPVRARARSARLTWGTLDTEEDQSLLRSLRAERGFVQRKNERRSRFAGTRRGGGHRPARGS